MALNKTQGSTFVERATQWVRDVGEKVKAAVGQLAKRGYATSGYEKAAKPQLKEFDAKPDTARSAAKFADDPNNVFSAKNYMVGLRNLEEARFQVAIERLDSMSKDMVQLVLPDDKMREILTKAQKDPAFKDHIGDIEKALKPHKK